MACCCGHPALVHEATATSGVGTGACAAPDCGCPFFAEPADALPRGSGAAASTWTTSTGERGPNVPAVGPRHITTRRAGRTVHEDPCTGTEVDP